MCPRSQLFICITSIKITRYSESFYLLPSNNKILNQQVVTFDNISLFETQTLFYLMCNRITNVSKILRPIPTFVLSERKTASWENTIVIQEIFISGTHPLHRRCDRLQSRSPRASVLLPHSLSPRRQKTIPRGHRIAMPSDVTGVATSTT